MLVKSKISFVRDLLYFKEVIKFGSIKRAAEKNGIKASNLSKLMTDFEKKSGTMWFVRSTHGVTPTRDAVELLGMLERIDGLFDELLKKVFDHAQNPLKVYVANGICIPNIEKCVEKFEYVMNASNADVIVDIKNPKHTASLVISEIKLPQSVVQSIWVWCKNESRAVYLSTFIISQILDSKRQREL